MIIRRLIEAILKFSKEFGRCLTVKVAQEGFVALRKNILLLRIVIRITKDQLCHTFNPFYV